METSWSEGWARRSPLLQLHPGLQVPLEVMPREVTRGTRRRLASECSCGSHGLGTAHGVAIETPGDNDNTSSKSPQMCKRKGWEEVNEVLVFGGCDGKRKKKRERKRKASPPLQQAREECHSLEQKLQDSQ